MAKKMPVGTVRSWKKGDVIKAHEGCDMHSGWIRLESPDHMRAIFREADRLANLLIKKKDPIRGELYLDHELKQVKREPGQESGPYAPSKFKMYEGFYGAGHYSFFNEFSRLFMSKKIQMQEHYIGLLSEFNIFEKGGNDRNDKTSSEEKKEIKRKAKETFEFNGEDLNEDDAYAIIALVKKVYAHMEKGMNLDPDEKVIYDRASKLVDMLPLDYVRLAEAKKRHDAALGLINKKFDDNWAIRESFRIKAQEKYNEYLRKYKDRIAEDEAADQAAAFGINIDDPVDEFYSAIYNALDEELDKVKNFDFNEVRGKKIDIVFPGAHNGEPTADCRFVHRDELEGEMDAIVAATSPDAEWFIKKPKWKSSMNELTKEQREAYYLTPIEPEDELYYKAQLKPIQKPIAELVKIRFATKYQKELEGNWTYNLLPAMESIERAITTLPEGHVSANDFLGTFSQTTFSGGPHGGYAWYSSDHKKINFSDDCAKYASIWARNEIAPEFKATMYHEIGHAVSKKFGQDSNIDYKKFAVACGWSYEQAELRAGMTATGGEKDIPRHGSNSRTPLLTTYAHKSQEEAFAEYYSIYNLHKDAIDHWLDTGDDKKLRQATDLEVPQKIEKRTLGEYIGSTQQLPATLSEKVRNFKTTSMIDFNDHCKIDLISPHRCSVAKEDQKRYAPRTVIARKRREAHHAPPVFAVKDKNRYKILDGINRRKEFMLKHKMMPASIVSQELYSQMRREGFTDAEIIDSISNHLHDHKVPIQASNPVRKEGVFYRNNILDVNDLNKNKARLAQMRKIHKSDKLAKALQESFATIRIAHEAGQLSDERYYDAIVKYNKHREMLKNG